MIDILYEDDVFMAINKRSGLLVTPNDDKTKNLTDELNSFLLQRGDLYKAHPCHRLDKETSGVILFAKGKKNQKLMMDLFITHAIRKFYIALVRGVLPQKSGSISIKIENKDALTKYQVIAEHQEYSVVHIELLTGRTNQIRIHFNAIGHPLLGESKFAYRRDFAVKFPRVALHAECISFRHPTTGESIEICADVPMDLQKLL